MALTPRQSALQALASQTFSPFESRAFRNKQVTYGGAPPDFCFLTDTHSASDKTYILKPSLDSRVPSPLRLLVALMPLAVVSCQLWRRASYVHHTVSEWSCVGSHAGMVGTYCLRRRQRSHTSSRSLYRTVRRVDVAIVNNRCGE